MKVLVDNGGDPPGYFLGDGSAGAIEIIGRPAGQTGANQRWVCHVAFWVDDYPNVYESLKARGIAFEADTAVDTDAVKTAFFLDPEGNRCQIVWRRSKLGK
jgi:glyoxylase I family protein